MALVLNDRVKETTTTTGTDAIVLGGAATGFETFAQGIGNSNTTYYAIIHESADEWEVGLGTLDGDSSDLTRTTVLTSSNSDSAVNFSSGNKTVICTLPASKAVFEDGSGNITIAGADITTGTNTSGNLLIADGSKFSSTAVSALSEISTVANDDVLLAIDTSGGGLKKISRSTVVSGLATSSAISNVVEDTTPQLGGNLDTNSANILIDDAHFIGDENGNEQIIFQTTSSAVNQIDVTNAATGSGPTISSTGGDTNINLNLTPKGSGVVLIDGQVGIEAGIIDLKNSGSNVSKILFYCESSNAHAQTLIGAPHSESASNTLTLPSSGGDSRLLSAASTATLTNKTLTTPVIAEITSGSTITLNATTDIVLDADGGDVFLKDDGTTFGEFTNSSTDFVIKSTTSDKDILFKGNDGGSAITALTLDMSDAGTAVFNHDIVIPDAAFIGSSSDKDAIQIEADGDIVMSQDLAVAGALTVTGNFTVNGTTSTVNTTNLTVTDPLVKYGQGSTGTSVDQGFIVTRGDGSSSDTANRGFIWDESADEFATVAANTEAGTTAGNVTINDYADIHVGKITADDASVFSAGASFGDANITNVGSIAVDSIINDDTDILIDSAGDIILDAAGNDWSFKSGGTEVLKITNSSSDVIIKPIVDAKDLIFQQRDGTEVARIEDNGTFNVVTAKLAINGTAITSTAAELNLLDGVSGLVQADLTKLAAVDSTAAELNIMDGDTTATSTTMADADRVVVNDNGTMKQVAMTDISTYTDGGATALAIALG